MIGTTLAHYRITAAIGADGMGEAIKVLAARSRSAKRSPSRSRSPRPRRWC